MVERANQILTASLSLVLLLQIDLQKLVACISVEESVFVLIDAELGNACRRNRHVPERFSIGETDLRMWLVDNLLILGAFKLPNCAIFTTNKKTAAIGQDAINATPIDGLFIELQEKFTAHGANDDLAAG